MDLILNQDNWEPVNTDRKIIFRNETGTGYVKERKKKEPHLLKMHTEIFTDEVMMSRICFKII